MMTRISSVTALALALALAAAATACAPKYINVALSVTSRSTGPSVLGPFGSGMVTYLAMYDRDAAVVQRGSASGSVGSGAPRAERIPGPSPGSAAAGRALVPSAAGPAATGMSGGGDGLHE